MKTIKKEYTAPCTIVCKMQMEGVMVSASKLSLSNKHANVLFEADKQVNVNDIPVPATAGDLQVVGGSTLDGAKKHNLFYDEE